MIEPLPNQKLAGILKLATFFPVYICIHSYYTTTTTAGSGAKSRDIFIPCFPCCGFTLWQCYYAAMTTVLLQCSVGKPGSIRQMLQAAASAFYLILWKSQWMGPWITSFRLQASHNTLDMSTIFQDREKDFPILFTASLSLVRLSLTKACNACRVRNVY